MRLRRTPTRLCVTGAAVFVAALLSTPAYADSLTLAVSASVGPVANGVALAPLEPASGAYFGAYPREDSTEGGWTQQQALDFESLTGRKLAIDMHYVAWASGSWPSSSAEGWDVAGGRIPMISWGDGGWTGGRTAADASGNGRSGSYVNGVTLGAAGALANDADTAASFDGTNDYVQVAHHASLTPAAAITVEAWVKSGQATWNTYGFVASKRDSYTLHPSAGTQRMDFAINVAGSWHLVSYAPADITQWHHYLGSYDGSTLRLYVDGVERASRPVAGAINPSSSSLFIGRDDCCGGRYGQATLDEVAIYGRALTATQVKAHYEASRNTLPPPPPSYRSSVLADGPAGYWRLGESSGTTAADESGNGRSGSYVGGVTLGAPDALANDADTAASFDGVNDYLSIPHHASLTPAAAITVEAWAKSAQTTWNSYGFLVSKRDSYILHPWAGTRTMVFYVNVAGGWHSLSYTPAEITGWHHYVGSYDGSTLRLYVDGVERSSLAVSGTIATSTGALQIGRDDCCGGRYGNATIDEVALYGQALSAARVKAHYDASGNTLPPSPPDYRATVLADSPAAYWRLDERTNIIDAINSSSQDSVITAAARRVKVFAHPIFIRPFWEMNGDWESYNAVHSSTPGTHDGAAKLVAAWRRIHRIFAAEGATNAVWVWSPNCSDTPRGAGYEWNHWTAYYPGDTYVDWVACDGYNRYYSSWKSFAEIFTPVYADYPGKPFMASEIGSVEHPNAPARKAQWIAEAQSYIKASMPRLKAWLWFHRGVSSTEAFDWRVNTSQSSLDAYRAMGFDPYFNP